MSDRKMLRVSHSQLQVYKTCRMMYLHEYLKKMEVRAHYLPFVFGSMIHSAFEVFYESKGKNCAKLMKLAISEVYEEVDQGPMKPEAILDLLCEKAKAEGICEAYPETYKGDFLEFEEFIVEEHFELDFGYHAKHDLRYQGYIDGLFKDAAGDWWVFETKTKAYNKPDSQEQQNYVRKVHIDNQVLSYMWGGASILRKKFGKKRDPLPKWFPKGVIYNIIQKPTIRKKKTESMSTFRKRIKEEYTINAEAKEYFMRYPLQLNPKLVKSWWEETKLWLMEVATKRYMKSVKQWPMNSGACTSRYGVCRWMTACTSRKYEKLLYRKKDPNFVHPRLAKIRAKEKVS